MRQLFLRGTKWCHWKRTDLDNLNTKKEKIKIVVEKIKEKATKLKEDYLKYSSSHFLLCNLHGKHLKCLPVYSFHEEQSWNLSQIIPSCQRNSNCCKHKCQGSSYSDAETIMQHSQRDHCIIISFWMWLPLCVRCLHVRGRRRKGIVSLAQSVVLY